MSSQAFAAFYESWLNKQESFLEQLLVLSSSSSSTSDGIDDRSNECKALIAQVLSHYREFHEERTRETGENPFAAFSPPWLSSLERALLWFSGFKPSMVFSLAKRALGETLSEDQAEQIELMRSDTRREEKEIEKEMASVQESVAAPPMLDLVSRFGGLVDGETSDLEEAMGNLRGKMKSVQWIADALRESAVTKLLGVLSPGQAVRFLTAAARFTIHARRRGIENDLARPGERA